MPIMVDQLQVRDKESDNKSKRSENNSGNFDELGKDINFDLMKLNNNNIIEYVYFCLCYIVYIIILFLFK